MNEDKPKGIWKKPLKAPLSVFLWIVYSLVLVLVGLAMCALVIGKVNLPFSYGWLAAVFIVLFAVGLFAFCRWLCHWRNFKRFLFVLACLATLIALFYAEEDWRGKHDWETFKHRWAAKGERFDLASVIPPAVPDDQNFALAPVVATSWEGKLDKNGHALIPPDTNVVDRLRMALIDHDYGNDLPKGIGNWQTATMSNLKSWQQYYRTLAAKTNEFPVPPEPQSPAADVLLALSKYDRTIEELRQASRRPHSRFPLNYNSEPPAAIIYPHLAALKYCSQILQLRAIAELQNGQSDEALADVKLMLYLADSIRSEPDLISHLVRIAMVTITLQPIYEGLTAHEWSEAQLVELEQQLDQLDILSGYRVAMRGETIFCQIGNIEYLRRFPGQIASLTQVDTSKPPLPIRILSELIPDGWFYQNELRCARMNVEFYLPVVNLRQRTVSPSAVRRADAALEADVKRCNPYNFFERMLVPALGAASKRFAYTQESVNLARVGCALERYRLSHGEYPESLDSLAPQFIPKLPHDIINGEPLHYHRTSDGQFVLYSIGWDETDDGGTVAFYKDSSGRVDISKGDWVWRYPTK